mmetsp:Transcript_12423/g.13628  ORF Transcript_12423/g.13628 Transcript_12423/m.13628 type:complete len:205 (-) Transcript_12423:145-759(-)
MLLAGFLKIVDDHTELLNLFKLVHPEDTSNVPSRRPSFLAETRGNSSVSVGQFSFLNPLILVVGTDGLFRGCNQILFGGSIGIVRFSGNLVKLFIKIFELGNVCHNILVHKVGWLQSLVLSFTKKCKSIIDQGLVQKYTHVRQKVSTMTGNALSSHRFESSNTPQKFIVRQGFSSGKGILDFALGTRESGRLLFTLSFQRFGVQ